MKRRMLGSILAVGAALSCSSGPRGGQEQSTEISDAFRAKLAQLGGARNKLEQLGARPLFSRTRPNAGATRSAMRAATSAAVASAGKRPTGSSRIPTSTSPRLRGARTSR